MVYIMKNEDKVTKNNVIKVIKEIMSYVLIIIIVLLIKKYIFTPIRVNGESMYPTLKHNDIMILNEIGYYINGLERFDIVVVNTNGEKIIKRVIGLPGDRVEYNNNKLYVNDEEIEEDFSHADTLDFSVNDDLGYDVIPDDYYFVVGDNRINSIDSRIIGLVNKKQILGKTNFVVYPFSRFGSIEK